MKKVLCGILKAVVFFALVLAVLMPVSRLVERKDSSKRFSPFLENAEDYDVLFFGDSRFMNGMMPLEIWKDYGIAGYNLACYGNSMAATYWSMLNAFDYAKPKLVVIGVDGVVGMEKITGSSGDLHTAFDFYPLSKTKIRAFEDLMHDPEAPDARDDEGNLYRDIQWEYYFKLGKYHGRWNQLTMEDLIGRPEAKNGGELLVGIMPCEEYEIIEEDVYAEETGHGFAYLRKAIQACQEREIDILLVNLLSPLILGDQMAANTVASIASEYSVDFVDITRLDSVADYAVDCYDGQPHFNVSGTMKVTDYLGSYLHRNFDLPDRRNQAGYDGWEKLHHAYLDEKVDLLRRQTELDHVLLMLHDDDFDVSISVGRNAPLHEDDLGVLLMHNIAREHVLVGEEYDKSSGGMYPLEMFDQAYFNSQPYFFQRINGVVCESIGEEAQQKAYHVFEMNNETGTMLKISDRRTGEIIEQFQF